MSGKVSFILLFILDMNGLYHCQGAIIKISLKSKKKKRQYEE